MPVSGLIRAIMVAALGAIALPTAAGAAVSVSTVDGVLTIVDSAEAPINNAVIVACTDGTLTVKVNGGAASNRGACATSQGISITMNRGNDSVDTSGVTMVTLRSQGITAQISAPRSIFENTQEANTFVGGPLAETVITAEHDSNDTITTGGGNDVIHAPADGSIDAGPGTDTVLIAGSTALDADSVLRACLACPGFFTEVPATNLERATLTGTDRDDYLDAARFPGQATINALAGKDQILASPSGDVDGGEGQDEVTLSGSTVKIHFADITGDQPRTARGIEKYIWSGGPGDDVFEADFAGAFIDASGGGGNDRIVASYSGSRLRGGEGDDRLTLGIGVDDAAGGPGTDTFTAFVSGTYALTATTSAEDAVTEMEAAELRGSAEADVIDTTAFAGPVTVDGIMGNDTIRTGPSADRLTGGDGDDTFTGGPGNDTFDGGPGQDTVSYAGPIPVTVDLAGGRSGAADEADTLTSIETAIGSSGPDVMIGSAAAETLRGGDGPDRLEGAGGTDVLDAGRGADFMTGGPGGPGDGDVLLGADGFDTLSYAGRTRPVRVTLDGKPDDGEAGEGDQADPSNEVLVGGNANDILVGPQNVTPPGVAPQTPAAMAAGEKLRIISGGRGDDTVTGTPGRDMVAGGAGNDKVNGLGGNDAVQGGAGNDVVQTGGGNDRAYPKAGRDRVQLGAGDDVAFSNDTGRDEVTCGVGEDKVYSGAGDDEEPDCDSVSGTTDTSHPVPEANIDNTDDTIADGDCPFGDEEVDPASPCERLLAGDAESLLELDELGYSDFTEGGFGDEFDEDFFGEGFDDFGDAEGEDLFGKDPPAPSLKTRQLKAVTRALTVTVSCPKKADRRCIGELTAVIDADRSDKPVASGLLAIPAGKSARVKLKVPAKSRRKLKRAKQIDILLEGRDRGDQLWQSTTTVKLGGKKKRKRR